MSVETGRSTGMYEPMHDPASSQRARDWLGRLLLLMDFAGLVLEGHLRTPA